MSSLCRLVTTGSAGRWGIRVSSCSLSYCCVKWILSRITITLVGKWELVALSLLGLYCLSWFALTFGVIGRLFCDCGSSWTSITKTRLYNFDPFKPHFYIIKIWG